MPISIDYDQDNNVLYAKAEGIITYNDFQSYYSSLGSIGIQPHYRVLADYCDAAIKLNSEEITALAAQRENNSASSGNIKIAIVAKSDLQFGLSRIYKARVQEKNINMMVFRDKIEAHKWLKNP